MTTVRLRALSSIYGAMIGDAMGGTLEFASRGAILNALLPPSYFSWARLRSRIVVPAMFCLGPEHRRRAVDEAMRLIGGGIHRLAPAMGTDDSELTMMLLRGLAEMEHGQFDLDHTSALYLSWVSEAFDIGTTTRNALGAGLTRDLRDPERQVPASVAVAHAAFSFCDGSLANGSLMRASPYGAYGCGMSADVLAHLVEKEAALTHPHPLVTLATATYAVLVSRLVSLQTRDEAMQETVALLRKRDSEEARAILRWIEEAKRMQRPPNPPGGWAQSALSHAFYHFFHTDNFIDAIRETLLGGGDTDTNACIVGGLIGASECGVPEQFVEKLLACKSWQNSFYHPKHVASLVDQILAKAEREPVFQSHGFSPEDYPFLATSAPLSAFKD